MSIKEPTSGTVIEFSETVEIVWTLVPAALQYAVSFSSDGVTFSDVATVLSPPLRWVAQGLASNVAVLRVQAMDSAGAILDTSQVGLGLRAPIVPVGTVLPFAGSNAPRGFLLCDGQEVSRDVYENLFAVIGTTYGAGNGVGTFRVCDLRGRGAVGAGAGVGLTSRRTGDTFGAEAHTLAAVELPGHTHAGTTAATPDHHHGLAMGAAGTHSHNGAVAGGGHGHTGTTGTANAKFYRVVHQAGPSSLSNHIAGWAGGPFTDVNDAEFNGADHTHPFSTGGGEHSHGVAPDGDHTHALSMGDGGGHAHGFTTDAGPGGGRAHPNLSPSLVLNFIIKH